MPSDKMIAEAIITCFASSVLDSHLRPVTIVNKLDRIADAIFDVAKALRTLAEATQRNAK